MTGGRRSPVWPGRLLTLLVPLALALGGCDSGGGTEPGDDDSVLGTWVVTQGDVTAYLVITEATVTQYVGLTDGCFDHTVYEITARDGDAYTLDAGAGAFQVTLTREGDNLRVTDAGGSLIYQPSSDDPSELQSCVSPDDPALVCRDLPEISVGQLVEGELTADDPVLPLTGEYYDLYGLQLPAATDVVIEAASGDFDAYLVLYAGDGEYIDENDDDGDPGSTDARLEVTLGEGCFRVVVTSFFTGETGAYTLGVN